MKFLLIREPRARGNSQPVTEVSGVALGAFAVAIFLLLATAGYGVYYRVTAPALAKTEYCAVVA